MTKFTIEDLRDIAYRGSYDDLERELALQLLSSIEQAPVYLRPFGDDGETFVACDGNDERAITLYAAPQLPQPAAVDMAAVGEMPFLGTQENAFVSGWNACRAAMLAAAPQPAPDSEAQITLERLAVILHGSETDLNLLTVTAQSLMDRCKAGNSQVTPDRWIPVSERMPEKADEVLCAKEFDGPGDWRQKVGYYLAGKWTVYGASWTPTHWMPLPAAPQQEVKSALEHGMQRYAGAMQKLVDSGD